MRAPRPSRAAPSTGWCGSLDRVRTQQRLFEYGAWIRAQEGMVSLGRSLLVLEPGTVDELSTLVELFGRVLVVCRDDRHDELVSALRRRGWCPDSGYRLHEVSARRVLQASTHESLAPGLPAGYALRVVDDATPSALILGIQALHCAAGLDPLPEHYLRGLDDACRTFYLLAPNGVITGCGTAQDLGPAGPLRRGWSLGQNVCLGSELRGRGIGRLLIHHTDMLGLETFGAHHICSVVARHVTPSAAIGRELPGRHHVFFVDAQVRQDLPSNGPTRRRGHQPPTANRERTTLDGTDQDESSRTRHS